MRVAIVYAMNREQREKQSKSVSPDAVDLVAIPDSTVPAPQSFDYLDAVSKAMR